MRCERRKVILTGDRPTGPLHLGHYSGALATRVRLESGRFFDSRSCRIAAEVL